MVLESLKISWLERRPILAIFVGFVYTFIGFAVGRLFFPNHNSLPMLFLTALLIVPSLIKLLSVEERRERRDGLRYFFRDHRDVAEIYIFLSLGVFLAYVVLGLSAVSDEQSFRALFDYQLDFLERQEGLSAELIGQFYERPIAPHMGQFVRLLEYNLGVGLFFFVLSLAYGAGAIFLLVLNASVFAAFIVYLMDFLAGKVASAYALLGIFLIHLIPELTGFLLAAIAGGVISKALVRERWGSTAFKNVVQDGFVVLMMAVIFLALAALLEVYVTAPLFHQLPNLS